MPEPRFKIGDRVRMHHYAGTVEDVFPGFARTYYGVLLDASEWSRYPPQFAGAVWEEDLEPERFEGTA